MGRGHTLRSIEKNGYEDDFGRAGFFIGPIRSKAG